MKINIEFDESLTENEICIRCASLDEEIQRLQAAISDIALGSKKFVCYQEEKECYIPFHDILFFETESGHICAHTKNQVYQTKLKLYELEELLPGSFMRISKSTIANLDFVYSITRNLTASSVMEFAGTKKKAMLSRAYFKAVTERLKARKLGV